MTKKDDLPSLDSLDARIASARGKSSPAKAEQEDDGKGKSVAFRIGSELIAGVAVGGFLGYHADQWLGLRPACTIFGIFLGMAAGVMNIYRAASLEAAQEEDDAAVEPPRSRDQDGN